MPYVTPQLRGPSIASAAPWMAEAMDGQHAQRIQEGWGTPSVSPKNVEIKTH